MKKQRHQPVTCTICKRSICIHLPQILSANILAHRLISPESHARSEDSRTPGQGIPRFDDPTGALYVA